MASNYTVTNHGDLDTVFMSRTSTKRADVSYQVGGTDVSNRYEPSAGNGSSNADQISYNTGYKYNNTDLRYYFKTSGATTTTSTTTTTTTTTTPAPTYNITVTNGFAGAHTDFNLNSTSGTTTYTVPAGNNYVLTSVAQAGYDWTSYTTTGGVSLNSGTISTTVTVTGAGSITSNFATTTTAPPYYSVTINNGTLNGQTYYVGVVSGYTGALVATGTGTFTGWVAYPSGDASIVNASNTSTNVTINGGPVTIAATYEGATTTTSTTPVPAPRYNVTIGPTGGDGTELACFDGHCNTTATYTVGSPGPHVVQATDSVYYTFDHWTGDSNITIYSPNSKTSVVNVTGDTTVVGHFVAATTTTTTPAPTTTTSTTTPAPTTTTTTTTTTPPPTIYYVTLNVNPNGEGTIDYAGGYAPTHSGGYYYNEPVVIQVTNTYNGYTFNNSGWNVSGSGGLDTSVPGQISFYITGNTTVTANFIAPTTTTTTAAPATTTTTTPPPTSTCLTVSVDATYNSDNADYEVEFYYNVCGAGTSYYFDSFFEPFTFNGCVSDNTISVLQGGNVTFGDPGSC